MGETISLTTYLVQPEKIARKVRAEEYTGCGYSFARGTGDLFSIVPHFPSSSTSKKTQFIDANGKTASLNRSLPQAGQLSVKNGFDERFTNPFYYPRHESKAILKEIATIHSRQGPATLPQVELRNELYSSGLMPYSVTPCGKNQTQKQQLEGTLIEDSTMKQLTRTSRTSFQTPKKQVQQELIHTECALSRSMNILQVQNSTYAIRDSKSSIRSNRHQPIQNDRSYAIQQKFRQIEFAYSEHNVDQAHREIKEFLQHFGREFEQHPQYAERMALIKRIEGEYTEVITYASEFNSKEWVLRSKEKDIKIYMRTTNGTIAVLIESELDVPIEIFTTVLNEVDLHKRFIPFVVYSKEVKALGRNSKIGHIMIEIPFLSRREAFFQGAGYNRLDTNDTIFVFTRSIHDRPQLQELYDYYPKPKKESVMLDYKFLNLEYKPLTPQKGLLRMCVSIDLRFEIIPKFVMEYATKKFGMDIFESIVKISRKFKGSDWDKASQRRPETLEFFQRIIHEYFQKRGIAA